MYHSYVSQHLLWYFLFLYFTSEPSYSNSSSTQGTHYYVSLAVFRNYSHEDFGKFFWSLRRKELELKQLWLQSLKAAGT